MIEELDTILSSYKGEREELVPILQKVQEKFGFLQEDILLEVADFLGVPESNLYSVATFYTQFRFTPIGKSRVMVCQGTACHVQGAPQILDEVKRQLGIEEGETTSDMEYSLETVACIGCCALAPCLVINGEVRAEMTPKKVRNIFAKEK